MAARRAHPLAATCMFQCPSILGEANSALIGILNACNLTRQIVWHGKPGAREASLQGTWKTD
jgi:hypothetical protein